VHLGTHLVTGEKVAVKILEKDKIVDAADVERVNREVKVLKMLRHPNLIQLYEIIETGRQLCLVMEYCSGGELFDYIVASTRLKESEACKYYQQIIAGLEYLHRLGIVHRDLKPENLLLDSRNNLKIVDYGLSNLYNPDQLLKTACGSPCYAAPEMIARKLYEPMKVDIWSSGVVLFAMVCGFLPFEDPSTSALYQKIMNGDYKCPKFLSPEAVDLISKLLDTNPKTRLSSSRIKDHVWYRQVSQKLSSGVILAEARQRIDPKVLGKLDQYGIDVGATERALDENQYNADTATYFLLLKKLSGSSTITDVSSEKQILQSRMDLLNYTIGANAPPRVSPTNPRMKHRRLIMPDQRPESSYRISSTGGSSSNKQEFPKLKFLDASFRGRSSVVSPVSESFSFGRPPQGSARQKVSSVSPSYRKGSRVAIDVRKLITPRPTMQPRPPQMTPAPQSNGFRGRRRVHTPSRVDASFG